MNNEPNNLPDDDTLGPCGCVDYHMADCPLRTAAHDLASADDWDPYGDEVYDHEW